MIKVKSRGINDTNLYMFVAKKFETLFFFYNNRSDMCRPLLYCENVIILKTETPNYWHRKLSYFCGVFLTLFEYGQTSLYY